ncbi:CoA transferase, partial [Mycobacterium avium]|uniref:CoA transferase n=1 Tax=Mycobacterium avium TaxID=1764 RepID=UPI0018C86ABD
MASPSGPMAGVRVFDLTASAMGPYSTQIMAAMGANVLKVEPPQGDNTRYTCEGPPTAGRWVAVQVKRVQAMRR